MAELMIINNKKEANLVKLALYSLGNAGKYFRDVERHLYDIHSFNLTSKKPFLEELDYLRTRKNDIYELRSQILDRFTPVSADVYFQKSTLKYTNLDNKEEFDKYKSQTIKKFMFSDWGKNYRGIIIPAEDDPIGYAIYFINYEIDGMKFTRRISEDEFNEKYTGLEIKTHDLSENLPFSEFDDEFNDYLRFDVLVDLLDKQPEQILEDRFDPCDREEWDDEYDEEEEDFDTYNIMISRKEKEFLFAIKDPHETYDIITYDEEGYEEYIEKGIYSIQGMFNGLDSIDYYCWNEIILTQGYENTISPEKLENYMFKK